MRKNKLLKKGRINIVAQLCELPSTTHDYNSFIVDVDHSSVSQKIKLLHRRFGSFLSKSEDKTTSVWI
jgi:hypothetical protein